MSKNTIDSTLAIAGSFTGGAYVEATTPTGNPLITTVVIPIVMGIIVPFLKDLSKEIIKYLKKRMNDKKEKNNIDIKDLDDKNL